MLVVAKQKATSKSDRLSLPDTNGGSDQREKKLETVIDQRTFYVVDVS
jgi:hypothetical protein